jgi:hypothetical protein
VTWDVLSGGHPDLGDTLVAALTIPVGVELSVPLGETYMSAQFTMLDVGQLTAMPYPREIESDLATPGMQLTSRPVPTTQFRPEHLLAPGLFAGIAIPNTAILIAAGASFAPRLREYQREQSDGTKLSDARYSVWRFGLKMVVNLPLLEFF